jgi:hypothetical protein
MKDPQSLRTKTLQYLLLLKGTMSAVMSKVGNLLVYVPKKLAMINNYHCDGVLKTMHNM